MKPYSWWGVYDAFLPRALYEGHAAFLEAIDGRVMPSWSALVPEDRIQWESLCTCVGIQSGERTHHRFLRAWTKVFCGQDGFGLTAQDLHAVWQSLSWAEQRVFLLLNAHYNALTDIFGKVGLPCTHEGVEGYVDPRTVAR